MTAALWSQFKCAYLGNFSMENYSILNDNSNSGPKFDRVMYFEKNTIIWIIFFQGLEMALLANDACGSPIPVQMCLPWQFFDGKLFHSKLIKATQARNLIELCDGRVQMAYQIERTREIIMGGSHIIPSQRPMSMVHPVLWKPQTNKPKFQPKKKNKNKVCF